MYNEMIVEVRMWLNHPELAHNNLKVAYIATLFILMSIHKSSLATHPPSSVLSDVYIIHLCMCFRVSFESVSCQFTCPMTPTGRSGRSQFAPLHTSSPTTPRARSKHTTLTTYITGFFTITSACVKTSACRLGKVSLSKHYSAVNRNK